MTRYLVDNSVLQQLPRSASVRSAMTDLLDQEHELCSCAFSVDEAGFSARSLTDHDEIARRLKSTFLYLPLSPRVDDLFTEIRRALWAAGTGRAAGVVDVGLAAVSVAEHATVLHYDRDFDHIQEAYQAFNGRWIVPRGTVD